VQDSASGPTQEEFWKTRRKGQNPFSAFSFKKERAERKSIEMEQERAELLKTCFSETFLVLHILVLHELLKTCFSETFLVLHIFFDKKLA
jgi:5'-3' exonuclease